MLKVINKIGDSISRISISLAAVTIASVMMVVFAQVVLRFFNTGLRWSDTYCRYMTIWAVMLAANWLIKQGELLSSNFFDNSLPKAFLVLREYLYIFVFLILFAILTYHGWIQAWQNRVQNVNALPVTMFWIYLAIPVGTSLMFLQYVIKILNLLYLQVKGKEDVIG